jgi:hypothetical protein
MRSDSQGIPESLGSLGHRLVRDQLRMHNVMRLVIQRDNEMLTSFPIWRISVSQFIPT